MVEIQNGRVGSFSMKLFFSPLAASLVPRIVALEAGIELDYVEVDFRTKLLPGSGGDYRETVPLGLVPVLCLDDGTELSETSAIVQYLADRSSEAGLAPPWGTRERYELLQWLGFTATEVHKKVLWPIFNRSKSEDAVEFARRSAEAVFDHLERRLADRSYVVGERFTVADAYLAWALCLCPYGKLDLGARPLLRAYAARLLSRPSVRDAIAIETPLAAAAIERRKSRP
jgi:glutathione S-transferase